MDRDLEWEKSEGPQFFSGALWVATIMVAACLAISAVNTHYDDYLCTNPYYKELK